MNYIICNKLDGLGTRLSAVCYNLYLVNIFGDKNCFKFIRLKNSLKETNYRPLESYFDYKEALKIKEYFSYQLGLAFIKAYKNKWRGDLIKFYFKDRTELKARYKK
ncbi:MULTISPECIES: hypothetical protein [unclassified Campylobacter]|nr:MULTISPECIES: hypothetical protein [unclassified Campylobacter]KAA6224581.1 hypothetical protein FMM54_07990 [Campylobacter sp. LR185c]KAA6224823.1 hypothetical protein FMM57_08265 [Campylobacter sp. LR286c]KAA6227971.1 hypothetical protein FMM55_02035 [Campylobacter sp. LR196d]KAA6234387.1 hypothetical protein FMM56_00660 [Campylobacter sp. LR264d]